MNSVKFPYGLSNFEQIATDDYVFVDKTHFIPLLEKERFVSFLRPRRFGKSLFLSVLEHYYDVLRKDKFNQLFGKYYIGKNPTNLANSYRILNFNFSGINTETQESSQQGFNFSVEGSLIGFIKYYSCFSQEEVNNILGRDAEEMLNHFFYYYPKDFPIYILIDEYDHFTNEILYRDINEFKNSVSKNGYVRKFYEVIKTATQQGVVARVFITGVSPITLDSLTSGFNIIKHLTHKADFETLMGFTEKEVKELLNLVLINKNKEDEIMQELKRWYNGYKFYPHSSVQLYNSDMVLYFLDEFKSDQTFPSRMLDPNIMPDYGKLKQMFEVVNVKKNQEVLQEVLENGHVIAELIYQFILEFGFGKKEFVNFLYYLGNLTISGSSTLGLMEFKIPNLVIEELYWQYYATVLQEYSGIETETYQLQKIVHEMAINGLYEPFFEIIEQVLRGLSNRDYIQFTEKHIKMVIVAYMQLANLFYVRSEREAKNIGYIDIELCRRPQNTKPHKEYALEIKYLKKANKSQLISIQQEAKEQLLNYYRNDTELQSKQDLILLTVVVVKSKVYVEKVEG